MAQSKHTAGPWSIRHSRDGSGDIGITANGVSNVIAAIVRGEIRHVKINY